MATIDPNDMPRTERLLTMFLLIMAIISGSQSPLSACTIASISDEDISNLYAADPKLKFALRTGFSSDFAGIPYSSLRYVILPCVSTQQVAPPIRVATNVIVLVPFAGL